MRTAQLVGDQAHPAIPALINSLQNIRAASTEDLHSQHSLLINFYGSFFLYFFAFLSKLLVEIWYISNVLLRFSSISFTESIMATTVGVMQSYMTVVSAPAARGRRAQALSGAIVRLPVAPRRVSLFRCQATENGSSPTGLREAVDKVSKKEITKEDILRHQETDDSEKRSVFGAVPSSGSLYPRPEIERRPETGDRSFGSIFAFDGAAPETINGRLAMLGFVWAVLAEKATGLTVMEQVFAPGAVGLPFFIAVAQIFAYASVVPIINGESTDARSWGPFNARAERWNGRLAMIGFVALILDEMIRQSPVFH